MEHEDLLSEFQRISESEWLEQIRRETRQSDLESFDWKINSGIEMSPFLATHHTAGDPLLWGTRDWETGFSVTAAEPAQANRNILENLEGGANSPLITMESRLTRADLDTLFNSVRMDLIFMHFDFRQSKDPGALVSDLISYLDERAEKIPRGSLRKPEELTLSSSLFQKLTERFDELSQWTIVVPQSKADGTEADREVASAVKSYRHVWSKINQGNPGITSGRIVIELTLGTSHLLEIARIRALKRRIEEIHDKYDIQLQLPFLDVTLNSAVLDTQDHHHNKIVLATQALTAAIAGVHRLTIPPSSEPADSSSIRISRNLHHLMKLESHLHQVEDPLAGSYYIESLTDKIMEASRQIETK
jgi:methylmalonyl-CoA mutase